MVSVQLTKVIQNLKKKKFRDKYKLFKVEGEKIVGELIQSSFKINKIIALKVWADEHTDIENIEVDEKTMKKLSDFETIPKVMAIVEIPDNKTIEASKNDWYIILNAVQDPGNLGTIIRTADWFGVKNIVCDYESCNCYNSKVIQASMGAIFRTNVYYQDIVSFITNAKKNKIPCYGAFLEGESIYDDNNKISKGIIIMGNEGSGINKEIENIGLNKICIPNLSKSTKKTESLNVGVAMAIIISEFKRREIST